MSGTLVPPLPRRPVRCPGKKWEALQVPVRAATSIGRPGAAPPQYEYLPLYFVLISCGSEALQ